MHRFILGMVVSILSSLAVAGCGAVGLVGSRSDTPPGVVDVWKDSDLSRHGNISVLDVHKAMDSNDTLVDLAIENKESYPIRLIGLGWTGNCLAIDDAGFAHEPRWSSSNDQEATALPRAKTKLQLRFDGEASRAKVVRIYNHDYPVPKP